MAVIRIQSVVVCLALLVGGHTLALDAQQGRKPSLVLRASTSMAFAPERMVVSAELRNPPATDALYCPDVEWEWGDGTTSEVTADCEPYQDGAPIKTRYVSEHTYTFSGHFQVRLRLKRQDRTLITAVTSVVVKPGHDEIPH